MTFIGTHENFDFHAPGENIYVNWTGIKIATTERQQENWRKMCRFVTAEL